MPIENIDLKSPKKIGLIVITQMDHFQANFSLSSQAQNCEKGNQK